MRACILSFNSSHPFFKKLVSFSEKARILFTGEVFYPYLSPLKSELFLMRACILSFNSSHPFFKKLVSFSEKARILFTGEVF